MLRLADKRGVKIGAEIKKAREAAGLSRQELAQRAGVSRVYVWQVETDVRAISLEVFMKIAKALGIKASTLLARIERSSLG